MRPERPAHRAGRSRAQVDFFVDVPTAAGARDVRLWGPPPRVCSQIAFPGCYLVDPSCHELAKAHKGPGLLGRQVVVVSRGGEQPRPVLYERLPNPLL